MIYGTTKSEAETLAAGMSHLIGGPIVNGHDGSPADFTRTIAGFRVEKYTGTQDYGIVMRWTYNDRPDLPEFGGGFFRLDDARRLAR